MNETAIVTGQELITVKQLAVIEDQLEALHRELDNDLRILENLVPTDENYKELKKIRADWNKKLDALETARKRVKAEIESPYKKFEAGPYKDLYTDIKKAVGRLDTGLKDVEAAKKKLRQQEVETYFHDYRTSLGLDPTLVPSCPVVAGLSESMKSLKERVKAYLDKIDSDLKTIETLENRDEIMAEYRLNLDFNMAVRTVKDRIARQEAEKQAREAAEEARRAREAHEASVDAAIAENAVRPSESAEELIPDAPVAYTEEEEEIPAAETPVSPKEDEAVLCTKYLGYQIYGTLPQLKALKAYLKEMLKKYLDEEGLKYGDC